MLSRTAGVDPWICGEGYPNLQAGRITGQKNLFDAVCEIGPGQELLVLSTFFVFTLIRALSQMYFDLELTMFCYW